MTLGSGLTADESVASSDRGIRPLATRPIRAPGSLLDETVGQPIRCISPGLCHCDFRVQTNLSRLLTGASARLPRGRSALPVRRWMKHWASRSGPFHPVYAIASFEPLAEVRVGARPARKHGAENAPRAARPYPPPVWALWRYPAVLPAPDRRVHCQFGMRRKAQYLAAASRPLLAPHRLPAFPVLPRPNPRRSSGFPFDPRKYHTLWAKQSVRDRARQRSIVPLPQPQSF